MFFTRAWLPDAPDEFICPRGREDVCMISISSPSRLLSSKIERKMASVPGFELPHLVCLVDYSHMVS
jgi:hypothetical protein